MIALWWVPAILITAGVALLLPRRPFDPFREVRRRQAALAALERMAPKDTAK